MFFLWPALVLFQSIKNYRQSWAKNGLWLFIIFFGFTFIPREGNDSTRYILYFQELHQSNIPFSVFSSMLYSEGSKYVDIFQPLITLLVAKLTGDPRILMAVFATIFGFFYSRNIWYLIDKTDKLNFYTRMLIIIFSLIVPFWYINGVRFWTAAHIFLFGALPYLYEGKNKKIWVSLLSIFMHFSFIFPVLILLAYHVIKNRTTVFFIFFFVTIFVSEINIPLLRNILIQYTPEVFHSRIEGYTDDEKIEKSKSSDLPKLNWYVIWHGRALRISIQILLVFIYFKGKKVWLKQKELLRLFSFLLLFNGFANLGSMIPSVYRFISVAHLFSVSFLFLYFDNNEKEGVSKSIFLFLIPAMVLFLVVAIRKGFDNTGIFAFITNPLIAPFLNNEIALIDLIK